MNSFHPIQLEGVDSEIYEYLNFKSPKSFLLFAGAGSGKTRSLVNVLKKIRENDANRLIQQGQKVAVITYTNAACDEIKQRLEYDPVFLVSTIHSFAWDLIKTFTSDIREWLHEKLKSDILELEIKISRARNKLGKTAQKNTRSRDNKQRRLDQLNDVSGFIYSPDGRNSEKGSLNHSEVIGIAADFIKNEPMMQRVLVNRFPILLVDESQDTNKELLEAFIETQRKNHSVFSLGLFGDMMQRIYGGGKSDLDSTLPPDWKTPEKLVNYRCPKRIIRLINDIRSVEDSHRQCSKPDAIQGTVRLYLVDANRVMDKFSVEKSIHTKMALDTGDDSWSCPEKVKTLTLEHHMAAVRGGFADFFIPLLEVDKLRDAALNGQSTEIKFINNQLIPIWDAVNANDDFSIANVLRRYSPILSSSHLEKHPDPISEIRRANSLVTALSDMIDSNPKVTLLELLSSVSKQNLLSIPDAFVPFICEEKVQTELKVDAAYESEVSKAWEAALNAPFENVTHYSQYISEKSGFGTHQGVKGLEFKRVMAILDDEEARGFLFKYEKLLGAEPFSGTDIRNETDGIDSGPKRTRRLFYVICSRAEDSLAVVAYTKDPNAVREYALNSGWFKEDEIVCS